MASRGLHVFFPTTSCSLDTFFSRCPIFYLPELTFSSSTFWFKSVKDSCSFLCRYQCKAFFSPDRPHTTLLSWEHVNQLGVEEKRKRKFVMGLGVISYVQNFWQKPIENVGVYLQP